MITTSPTFVRTILIVAALALSSPALAQSEQHDLADDAAATAPVTQIPEPLPTVLPFVPIRAWQLAADAGGVKRGRAADQVSWQMGRSIGSVPRIPQPPAGKPHSAAHKGAQRVLAGVAMGVLGMVAGTLVGGLAGSAGCGCEDGALYGVVIGAPAGAAAGATLGVLMVR